MLRNQGQTRHPQRCYVTSYTHVYFMCASLCVSVLQYAALSLHNENVYKLLFLCLRFPDTYNDSLPLYLDTVVVCICISDRYCHTVLLSIVAAHVLTAKSTVNFGTTVVGYAKNIQFSLRFVNVHKINRITGYKHFF